MPLSRSLMSAVALTLLLPLSMGDAAAPYAPSEVTAAPLDPSTVAVAWAPGVEPAEAYRVYGGEGGSLTLLLDTAHLPAPVTLAALVPSGFDAYAVSGVRQGQESTPVFALNRPEVGCLHVQRQPPDVWFEECDDGGAESAPVFSIHGPLPRCIAVSLDPPEVGLKDCPETATLPVEVRVPLP